MSDWNTIEEYLVRIGADIDQNSFGAARSALTELKSHLVKLKGAAAPLALATAIGAIGKAAYETVKGVAKADMEYQKLAASMWTTKETAKALSVAMKTMGVSQDDIAWVPELREQFFRLRGEMQKFATPADADAQLRYIREIGYDVQVLFVRLKMLKEWIAYYLIKYLEPYIEDFRAFLNWLLDKLGTDMPGLARTVARAMSMVLQPALATIKALGMAIGKVYDFIVSLPDNVKKWGAVFAAVGAIIMAGPFGALLAGLSMAMILIEDFMGYMNGWESSETLAPIWKALLEFSEGTGSEWMQSFKTFLSETARLLDNIVKSAKDFFGEIKKNHPEIVKFGDALLGAIKLPFEQLKTLSDLFITFLKAINLLLEGKRGEALDTLIDGVKQIDFTPASLKTVRDLGGSVGKEWRDSISDFGHGIGEKVRKFFGFGGSGAGADVVNNASQFEQGTQWMDPTGENKDSRNQCASFASQMMASAGVDVEPTMNGDLLAGQFKSEGAYHPKGDGYQPQPGDLIDWAHHVGIYAGNGEYIARNSSGGVQRGSMFGMEQYFGSLWGFGSVSELQAAKGHADGESSTTGNIAAGMLDGIGLKTDFMPGKQEMAAAPLQNAMPNAQESATGNNASMSGLFSGIGLKTGFMPGEQEMATAPIRDSYADALLRGELNPAWAGGAFGGGGADSGNYNFGGSTVNIYVRSTSATPQEIGSAAKSGVEQGMNETLHIMQRFGRRAEV